MLTSTGYASGLLVYVLSALLALVLANWWFLRDRGLPLKVLLTPILAAVLLTPAYIEAGGETLAPALIVAAFQWLSAGPEAADHALRPLGLFSAIGATLGIMGALVAWRRHRQAGAPDPALDLSTDR